MAGNHWESLKRIRSLYLKGGGIADYWSSPEILEAYHQTFGQRILWKWQSVLGRMEGFFPAVTKQLRVLDWGCGTGVAGQAFLERFSSLVATITPYDRSRLSMGFTRANWQKNWPKVAVERYSREAQPHDVVLVSHVSTEIAEADYQKLLQILKKAKFIIWVEPGTSRASALLVKVREDLRSALTPVQPCPHTGPCGLSHPDRSGDWCHFFAEPPQEAFQSAFWREFAKSFGVDLRSLPVSYLSMRAEEAAIETSEPVVLGRARNYKGFCKFLRCSRQGVEELALTKRESKAEYKRLVRGGFLLRAPVVDQG